MFRSARPIQAVVQVAIELPAMFDVGVVSEFLARLAPALAGPEIVLDGSKLQRLDTGGVQGLCGRGPAADRRGVTVRWSAVSPMLVSYAGLLGVDRVLRFDGVRREGLEWFE
jgi:anti-anti-sigma regulatory factor